MLDAPADGFLLHFRIGARRVAATGEGTSMARPELMAIGDSLGNGVRSLTINKDLAAHAAAAQVAGAFNWDFITPDYPRPMLANFEAIFRDPLAGTLDLIRNAANNAHAWLADQSWSQQPLFHNLSIAQQVVADTYTANYAASLATATAIASQGVAMPIAQLPVLYQALNTCFVLNPARLPNDRRTAIDILAEAKPKRLLIHIGVNDGLWTLLLMADPTNYATRIDPIPSMKTLALHLKEYCGDIEHFYINLFPKPSAIANLMPPWAGGNPPNPVNGYYSNYIGELLGNGGIAGPLMQQIDVWIRDVLNAQVRDAFAPLGERAHFVGPLRRHRQLRPEERHQYRNRVFVARSHRVSARQPHHRGDAVWRPRRVRRWFVRPRQSASHAGRLWHHRAGGVRRHRRDRGIAETDDQPPGVL